MKTKKHNIILIALILVNISSIFAGKIIFVNGTTSSGKTSRVDQLQEISNNKFKVIKLDDWLPGAIIQKAKELHCNSASFEQACNFLRSFAAKKQNDPAFDFEKQSN